MKYQKLWIAVSIGLVAVDLLLYMLLQEHGVGIASEHGLLENLQALLLAAATAVFLFRVKGAAKDISSLYLCGALLCFTMFVREYDVRKLDVPHFLIILGSGSLKNMIFVILWVLGVWNVVHRFRAVSRIARTTFSLRDVIPLVVSMLFIVLGEFFEKRIIPVSPHVFYEELSELNGYLILLIASIIAPRLTAPSASIINERFPGKPHLPAGR